MAGDELFAFPIPNVRNSGGVERRDGEDGGGEGDKSSEKDGGSLHGC